MEKANLSSLPEPTLRRLPWYLSRLTVLRAEGVDNVSSTQLGKELHLDSSVIAKDLSFINIKGKTRIGYDVVKLERFLRDFLGFNKLHPAVVMGVGSLGEALVRDHGLRNYGLDIVAGFDVRPDIIGTGINGIPVYSVDDLPEECRKLKAEIGIITVPVEMAEQCAASLIDAGIKAIWNFTPMRIKVPPHIAVQNTSIYAPRAIIYNRLKEISN